jgi:hypothetical protein
MALRLNEQQRFKDHFLHFPEYRFAEHGKIVQVFSEN